MSSYRIVRGEKKQRWQFYTTKESRSTMARIQCQRWMTFINCFDKYWHHYQDQEYSTSNAIFTSCQIKYTIHIYHQFYTAKYSHTASVRGLHCIRPRKCTASVRGLHRIRPQKRPQQETHKTKKHKKWQEWTDKFHTLIFEKYCTEKQIKYIGQIVPRTTAR